TVGVLQGLQDLPAKLDDAIHLEAHLLAQKSPQRLPLGQRRDDEAAVLVRAGVVDRHDARVAELRGLRRLLQEAVRLPRLVRALVDAADRDLAPERHVHSAEDLAQLAGAERLLDAVAVRLGPAALGGLLAGRSARAEAPQWLFLQGLHPLERVFIGVVVGQDVLVYAQRLARPQVRLVRQRQRVIDDD